MSINKLQIREDGRLRHFLSTEGLNKELLTEILDTAESFAGVAEQSVKKVPLLRGKTIVNLFFEASTRTRTTFELAAKRLSADVLNINVGASATVKGETLLDTLSNLQAMHVDMFVVRHADSGTAHFIARHVLPHVSVINAGDGSHEHPTQALLDALTIRRHKKRFEGLTVAICGDILHSRVARSNISRTILSAPCFVRENTSARAIDTSAISSTTAVLSMTGWVSGVHNNVVMPLRAAAAVSLANVALCS